MFQVSQAEINQLAEVVLHQTSCSITLIDRRPFEIADNVATKHQIRVKNRKKQHWEFNAKISTLFGIMVNKNLRNSKWYFQVDRENALLTDQMMEILKPTIICALLSEQEESYLLTLCKFLDLKTLRSSANPESILIGGPRFNMHKFLRSWRFEKPIFFFSGDSSTSTAKEALTRTRLEVRTKDEALQQSA